MTLRSRSLLLACVVLVAACGADARPPRDLAELMVRDSVYFDPGTALPYSGPVFRAFPDDVSRNEIEGTLVEGSWDGEMVVYHPSGRIRYMGAFHRGDRCGPWTENRFDREPEDALEQLRTEIATLGMHPPCPDDG